MLNTIVYLSNMKFASSLVILLNQIREWMPSAPDRYTNHYRQSVPDSVGTGEDAGKGGGLVPVSCARATRLASRNPDESCGDEDRHKAPPFPASSPCPYWTEATFVVMPETVSKYTGYRRNDHAPTSR